MMTFVVDFLNFWLDLWVELSSLVTETVEPVVLIFLIISLHIESFASKVLPSQFQGSLNQDLLHAPILWLSFNVWSWLINPLGCIEFRLGAVYVVSALPSFMDINGSFRFGLQQAPCSLVCIAANWRLTWCTESNFELLQSIVIQFVFFRLHEILLLFGVLVKHWGVFRIGIVQSSHSMSPSLFDNSFTTA